MHRDLSYLTDILESAKTVISYLSNISIEEFYKNGILQDAVIRRIEIIGEASSRVSEVSQKKYPDLPWREMKGMRNLLIHEYDVIDIDEVWNTVKNELPKLIKQIEKIIK
jgi:uncharacterized protein with HEPN domain